MITEYPALVFKASGPYQRKGGGYSWLGVNTEHEYKEAIKDGWFKCLDEAIEGKTVVKVVVEQVIEPPVVEDNAPPTRAELETKAKELGIRFHPSVTDDVLASRIADKLKV